jgi:hypothetical protein
VVVYGATGTDVRAILKKLFKPHPSLYNDIDVAYFMGKVRDGVKRPVIVHFSLQSSALAFLRMVRTEDYMRQNPGVTASRDKSVTRRVGVSRLSASASRLVAMFPGLTVHEFSEFATYRDVRYDATEFAEKTIKIDGRQFDMEDACRQNQRYEPNEALFLSIGDMKIKGFRRKDRSTGNGNPSGSRADATQSFQQRQQGAAASVGQMLSNINTTSSGGIIISGGPATRYSSSAPSMMIGANADPYEVRR